MLWLLPQALPLPTIAWAKIEKNTGDPGRIRTCEKAVLTAMLAYNLPVTAYLMYLRIAGELVGILLWPAIVTHAVFTIWFVLALSSDQRTKATTQ